MECLLRRIAVARLRHMLAALLVSLCVWGAVVSGEPPVPSPAAMLPAQVLPFVGDFRDGAPEANLSGRDEAIEGVVAELNVMLRDLARRKIKEGNPVVQSLEVSLDGENVAVVADGRRRTAPLDGSVTSTVGATGVELEYRVSMRGASFVEHFEGGGGTRTNVYTRTSSGLRVKVIVTSPRLPKDLVYTLQYRG